MYFSWHYAFLRSLKIEQLFRFPSTSGQLNLITPGTSTLSLIIPKLIAAPSSETMLIASGSSQSAATSVNE